MDLPVRLRRSDIVKDSKAGNATEDSVVARVEFGKTLVKEAA